MPASLQGPVPDVPFLGQYPLVRPRPGRAWMRFDRGRDASDPDQYPRQAQRAQKARKESAQPKDGAHSVMDCGSNRLPAQLARCRRRRRHPELQLIHPGTWPVASGQTSHCPHTSGTEPKA
eukprot:359962-Chlamydomonas_euryale.AAC.3